MHRPGEKDIAASVVPEYAQPWDKAVESRVVRKIDLALIPLMWVGYGLVYFDKAILGAAAVFGMITDLELTVVTDPATTPPKVSTTRLSWATSLFYFGMLAGVGPLTYLFQRFHLGRTIGLVVIVWGAIAMSTAGVTTHQGLWAQRFFLGFAESIMPTAFMVIVSGYYTQKEQTWRQCLWYSATGGWTVIGAAINFGFAHITGGDLKKWQYLYLMAGSLTVLYGIVFLFFPNSPAQAWWFDEEEKRVAIERLRMGQLGVRCQKIKWSQFREALLDLKIWIIAVMMGAAYSVNGAVSGFGPLIVSTFGWSAYDSLLWQMPLGGVCFVGILVAGFLSLKVPNIRLIMLVACCLPVITGCAMIWKSTWYEHAAAPIAGYTIIGFFAPVTSLIVSMGMANVSGNTKKSYMAAATFVMYTVGNISSPFFIVYQTVDDHYPGLWEGVIGCYVLVIVLATVLYIMLKMENRRRNQLNLEEKEAERIAFDDLTDKENMYFRSTSGLSIVIELFNFSRVTAPLLQSINLFVVSVRSFQLLPTLFILRPGPFTMFALRRCASRFLSSRPPVLAAPSRTYTSFSTPSIRIAPRSSLLQTPRRWASTEPEKGPQVPISESPSAEPAPAAAESTNTTEAAKEALPAAETNGSIVDERRNAAPEAAPAAEQVSYTTPAGNAASAQGTPSSQPPQSWDGAFERKPTLYVGNLFFDVTETDLIKEFARFGTVLNCRVIRDSRGLSKGFAYVDFSAQEAADAALQRLNLQLFEGRRITVQYAARQSNELDSRHGASPPQPRNPPSKTLFIGNMSFEMTDRDLSNLFRGVRNVIDVRVAIDRRTGQPRGFAHADFIDVKSAMEAMNSLQGKEIYGRKLRVDYSFSSVNRAPRNQPPPEEPSTSQ
ncbi:uncharacterized protein Z518_09461 [Rhinocladiella mackenziei CBS 650.93]|uniref:Rhinocladiella mackenziei CBS 650.93 unplaced genomic scaffold supercont1.7, whole genome shotgun sequence n=1 Tax=Rhinocladiella mackenziei CBS 650.93 TaxID=1442369 RepID=A0A0D2IYN5_9EURO|nr:uncharacterized protein Z518_09461 [Rhinocladiella mackenziei CBS 650.93]KIX01735.1 hypothetical protein Z518_09461 [Rhinocladiella mackenziei CBS 650.93]